GGERSFLCFAEWTCLDPGGAFTINLPWSRPVYGFRVDVHPGTHFSHKGFLGVVQRPIPPEGDTQLEVSVLAYHVGEHIDNGLHGAVFVTFPIEPVGNAGFVLPWLGTNVIDRPPLDIEGNRVFVETRVGIYMIVLRVVDPLQPAAMPPHAFVVEIGDHGSTGLTEGNGAIV